MQQAHRETCTVTGLAASQPLCDYMMTMCPPESVCQKDQPCCVIEAANSILVAVLGQPARATVPGCLVTEFPSKTFLTGPGLTHTPAARPVVTDTMDAATICQRIFTWRKNSNCQKSRTHHSSHILQIPNFLSQSLMTSNHHPICS